MGVLVVVLGSVALYVGILVYPAPLFAHHQRVGGLRISSDRVPSVDVEELEADVAGRLAAMEHEAGRKTYNVLLCHSPRRYRFFARLTRRTPTSQAIVLSAPGNIFVSMPRLAQLAADRGDAFMHSRFEGSLAFAIAHEVAHLRIAEGLGQEVSRSLPAWKSEGWADYQASLAAIRSDPDYDLAQRIDLLDDATNWLDPRLRARQFFRWQLLVEFLAEVRGFRFEDLNRPSVTESETWEEMRDWYRGSRVSELME
jgi:hypothetical protein